MFFVLPLTSLFMMIMSIILIIFLKFFHMMFFWISLELVSFSMIWFFLKKKSSLMLESVMKFFLIQSISSIMMLLSSSFFSEFSLNWSNEIFLSIVFCLCFFLKMGLFPLHSWMMHIVAQNDVWLFFLMMTIQKLLPLLFFSKTVFWGESLFFLKTIILLNLIFVCFSLLNFTNMILFFFFSSILHMVNIFLLFFADMTTSSIPLLYFFMYSFVFFFMCSLMFFFQNFSIQSLSRQIYGVFLWGLLVFSGFPPLSFFFLKMFFISNFLSSFGFLFFFVFVFVFSIYIFSIFQFIFSFKCFQKYSLLWEFFFQMGWMEKKSFFFLFWSSFGFLFFF